MQVLLVEFSWIFTFLIVYSPHVITYSVHGQIFPPPSLLGDVAINCGCLTNSTAHDGRYWVGETSLLQPKGKSRISTSAQKFLSADPTPYLTARISFSYFFYNFQVNPGQKFIRFHFYPESYQGFENSQDLFTVKANSFTLLQNFSASLAADALSVKYVIKEFLLNVNETGILQIAFFALQRKSKTIDAHAFVNGIEIISMPTGLYYTIADNIGSRIVGQKNHFDYVDNSTALELVQRLNVGGSSISPVDDTGMFRRWTEDVHYLQDSGFQQTSLLVPFVAPLKIYQTSRKLRKNIRLEDHFTWKIPVDVGFAYLLRLHFCYFGGAPEDFSIIIQDLVAETQLSGGKRIPVYKDYLVVMKGDKDEGKKDLFISLQSCNELVLELLKGLEIFKLSNTDNSLASPNPSCPKQTSSFLTLKIQNILLAFGKINVIMTALTIVLAIINFGVYQLRRICEYMHWHERIVLPVQEEPSCRRFSLTEILLATQDFNEALVIGKGGFGKVYKGFIHRCPEILAVKRLKPDSKQGAHEFWREIETLSKLRHNNLVSLLGYCMEREEMILVYEYMPRGNVAEILYKSDRNEQDGICLMWEQRLKICIGAARGLDYLHTGTPHGLIHRDVKDTNILLDDNFVPKISDFGLSKFGKMDETQGQLSSKIKGTRGYLDPDYLMTHKPSTKSDVYAFGIVMLVVLSGSPAVETRLFGETRSLLACFNECVKKGEMKEIIDTCLQEDISTESLTRFIDIVRNCLHRHPKKRPTMAQVVFHLEHALEEQIGTVASILGTDTIVGHTSPTGSNRLFNFYELQVAPVPNESIIALPGEDNTNIGIQNANLQTRAEVLQSKGKYGNITQKLLRGISWVALRNVRKPTKKMKLALRTGRVFSLKEIKLATQNFSKKLIIGRGGFGDVYKGFINGGSRIVAMKRMKSDHLGAEEFRTEVEILSTFNYIHLVPFVGYCNESNELIVVYEYMSRGALDNHLYRNNGSGISLTWEQRLRICIGAARGLNYLHEVGIIHRDVKDSNILLDENFVAKIADCGISKLVSFGEAENHVSTRVMGTYGYVDPSYMETGRLTKASDVYSFGVVLLVVLSGSEAFVRERLKNQDIKSWYVTCSQDGNFDELIDPKLVGGIPSASLNKFLNLIQRCLHDNPKHRPEMAQVVVNLEEAAQIKG